MNQGNLQLLDTGMSADDRDYDVLIIGAGVLGCAVARELSLFDLRVAMVEKASYVCAGQSKANGGIIHGGHDPEPGTLKARLNVEGNRLFPGLCESLGVPYKATGIYVVAFDDREMKTLEELERRGRDNGVPGLHIIDRREVLATEPNISRKTAGALSIPTGGIVDVLRLVIALAEHAALNGVEFLFNTQVTGIVKQGNRVLGAATDRGELRSSVVINCAGVSSDLIMKMAGIDWFAIHPRKGEYYILDRAVGNLVSRPCFPVPTPHGKGILPFPTIHGNTVIGGDSVEVEDRGYTATTSNGLQAVIKGARRMIPRLEVDASIACFSGLRATGNLGDFLIAELDDAAGLIHLAGVASPGLSAAPAIAPMVRKMVGEKVSLQPASDRAAHYRITPLFHELPDRERERWLKRDSRYGRIVCRCENVTEGDIIAAIHAPLPARTLDAIKMRTRTGMGRCQGAFDLSRVLRILARETGTDPVDIRKNESASQVVVGYTKG
jgi:glycerol-3-phosphate dehydrogenase